MKKPEFAPTDFFSRQDAAKARTGKLVLWFALAILGTTAAVYFAAIFCFTAVATKNAAAAQVALWDPTIFFSVLIGTTAVVGGASLYKSSELAGGGATVAESVGGRRVESHTTDPDERRLLNIVEEMSLASGVPVPDVYILDNELGINAFAAGDSIENAAVAVTHGALHKLTRDELQAVMGHEFAHVLNGDMRLNIRLIGWIFGLMALSVVGRVVMYSAPSNRGRDRENGGGAAIMLFGVLMMVIGFIGTLFAQLIQSAISRQREHLADAAATQFTRNPDALADALRRIAGEAYGTRLTNPHAGEIAHMCFGEGAPSAFATHPPLSERIRLLKPDWDGSALPPLDPERLRKINRTEAEVDREFRRDYMSGAASAMAAASQHKASHAMPADNLPRAVHGLVRDPIGAQVAAILLLMTDNPEDNNAQAMLIKNKVRPELFERLKSTWSSFAGVKHRDRLAVLQLAAPALRHLPRQDADNLVALLRELARSDNNVSFFEIALLRFVESITHPSDDDSHPIGKPEALAALRTLVGAVAQASGNPQGVADALARTRNGGFLATLGSIPDMPAAGALSVEAIDQAFVTLAEAPYALRKETIAFVHALIVHDGAVTDDENDLLRALAATLRCPTELA